MARLDHWLRRTFPADGSGPDGVRVLRMDTGGGALRVTLARHGDPEVALDLLRPGASRSFRARLACCDVIVPGPVDPASAGEPLIRAFVAQLRSAAPAATPLDWIGILGEDGDARFLAGDVAEIKLTAACDQRCVFCKSPRNLANHASPEEVAVLLPRLARKARFLTLSGGETTLAPDLDGVVRRARAAGFAEVEIQTNGMTLAEPGRAQRLADAGATNVLISLHAHRAERSDRLTGTPGGFERTLRGIDRALDAGLRLALCHVICEGNHDDVVPFVRFVVRRWPRVPLDLVFTLAIPTYRVRDDPGLMPPLSAIGPELRAALRRFYPARVPIEPMGPLRRTADFVRVVTGPLGPLGRRIHRRAEQLAAPPLPPHRRARVISHCGLPMCVLGGEAVYHDEWWSTGGVSAAAEMVHPPACTRCALRPRCSGLWRVYVERFGDDGIAPVAAADAVGDRRDPCYRAGARLRRPEGTAKCTSR